MQCYTGSISKTEGSTLADFLHTRTLNCREKSDEFRESSKRMASECDVTSERYRTWTTVCSGYTRNEKLNIKAPGYDQHCWVVTVLRDLHGHSFPYRASMSHWPPWLSEPHHSRLSHIPKRLLASLWLWLPSEGCCFTHSWMVNCGCHPLEPSFLWWHCYPINRPQYFLQWQLLQTVTASLF